MLHQTGKKISLINFVIGGAKMAIWLTRKRKLKGEGEIGPEVVLKALIATRIKAEFAYFKLMNNMDTFIEIWALNDVLCSVDYENELVLNLSFFL